ncbi:Phosphate transporter [Mycena venus]|uniref:Phosphate transporter n=1 Tax=Mycena venus TaxID=2733690 RepID=A0A8H6Z390_9AGAR|nr:Phosphate transporter [Mycena venus]
MDIYPPPPTTNAKAKGRGGSHYFLDERRRTALSELDNAKTSWFHIKVCLVAGVGFFTDAYDLFAINIGAQMLGYVYGHGAPGKLGVNQDLGVKVAAPVGTLCGQLLFGWLADIVGRKRIYGLVLLIMIIGTFVQALSGSGHAYVFYQISSLSILRSLRAGVGIGGDYPLGAAITSEFATTRIRGRMITAVFAGQGWGNFTAVLVAFILNEAYKNKIIADPGVDQLVHVDFMWRILFGIGCIPAVFALYFRLTLPGDTEAAEDIHSLVITGEPTIHDPDAVVQRVDAPRGSWEDFKAYFGKWENMKILIGTSYSWFALDIAFYGLGLNSSTILTAIGFGSPGNMKTTLGVYQAIRNVCVGNLIFSIAGLIPGYYASFLLIDRWGRRPIQLMGFIILTVVFIIMGFGYDKLLQTTSGKNLFVFLYCIANFFQNFGPNTTTYLIPGEIFPTRYRATAHGISAASGKFGAIVAQVGFSQMINIGGPNKFIPHMMEILAFFMLTGILSTMLLPETKQKTLEELSNENQIGFLRGPTTRIQIQDGIIVGKRVY